VSTHREVLGTDWESYRSRWLDTEYAFPTASELDVVVEATSEAGGLFRVESGSFNSTRIIERLSDDNFEVASGDSAQYSYYLRDDEQVGYAITDSTLVRAQIPSSLRGTGAATLAEFSLVGLLDTIIESKRGAVERYGDDSSDLIPLADQGLSGGSLLYNYHGDRFTDRSFGNLDSMAGEFPDHVVTGQGQKLSGETTDVTLVLVFENKETFIQNPLESSIDTYVMESQQFRDWREVSWSREERTVIIEGTVRSAEAWPLQQVTVG